MRWHRVAISNRRPVALNDKGITFKWKDYRLEGRERYAVMTLDTHEFIRRFLMHVLWRRPLLEVGHIGGGMAGARELT